MTSSCLFCGTRNEPKSVRKVKGDQVARYKCCGVRWLVSWLASALGEAAA